jgi:predicted small lipoprotein YifL
MSLRRPTLRLTARAVIVLAMIAALVACGDPKYQPPAIVVTFDPNFPPPTSINAGAYWDQGLAADVANDTKNAGVTFSCAPAGDCGSFNPTGAPSTVPTCYQAPGAVPTGGTVTVTATSATDPTKSVTSAPITITTGPPGESCE